MVGSDVTKKFFVKSSRVKGLDLHPVLPWVLISTHSGAVQIWNYESETMVKTFDVATVPVRDSKFIPSKLWIICATDEGKIIVYNLNTYEKVASFNAHSDYIRSLALHPSLSYVLSSSDDCKIKLWDWEKNWTEVMKYTSHRDYVMKVVFNPNDPTIFASASMDSTIKLWSIDSSTPKFTLEDHTNGVNDVDFYRGSNKPYLISASDDKTVKIWDYLLKTCIYTISKHSYGVTKASFLPGLPLLISVSEDGTARIWDSDTYRMEITLNYETYRVWTLAYAQGKSEIAIGHDAGTVIVKIGGDVSPASLDTSGKLLIAANKEVRLANLTLLNPENIKNCEVVKLTYKDLGICELYPQRIIHSNNGRFIAIIGGGEYVIYSSLAWRIKSFGKAADFAWGMGSTHYALRESGGIISIKKNFQDHKTITTNFVVKKICGGPLLALIGDDNVYFYSWESASCVGRVDVCAKDIIWSNLDVLAVLCEDMVYIIEQKFVNPSTEKEDINDNESENSAVQTLLEIPESINSGCWVGDLFFYMDSENKVTYYYNDEATVIANVSSGYNIIGYVPKLECIVLIDKESNVMLLRVPKTLIYCQELVASGKVDDVQEYAKNLPNEQKNILSKYLQAKGFYKLALETTTKDELKFELALMLKRYDIATEVAELYKQESMWLRIGEAAIKSWDYNLTELACKKANNIETLMLLYGSTRNRKGLEYVAECADKLGKNNIVLMCNFLLGRYNECVNLLKKHNCDTEAMLTAKNYAPELLDKTTIL